MAIAYSENKVFNLQIRRMPDGGFVVADGYRPGSGDYCDYRFASTSIEEAMKYCKRKLETDHGGGK